MNFTRYILFCWCYFLINTLSAQSILFLKDSSNEFVATPHLEIIEDHHNQLSFDQIVSGDYETRFRTLSQIKAYESETYWIRFEVRNLSSKKDYLVELPFDFVELYYKNSHGKIQKLITGNLVDVQDRSFFLGRKNIVPVELNIGKSYTFYIKIRDENSVTLNERISNKSLEKIIFSDYHSQIKHYQNIRFWEGIYLGILLIMMLYNAVLYWFTKDRSYIYYAIFILASGLNAATVEGFMLEFVWSSYPAVGLVANNYFISATWLFFLLFTRRFLNLYQISQKSFRFVQYLSYAYGFMILGLFLNLLNIQFLVLLMIITLITILYITFLTLRKGYEPAYYFLLGNVFFVFSIIITLLFYTNIIESNNWNIYIDQIGTVLQIFLFAVGLAKRVSLQTSKLARDKRINENLIQKQKEEIENLIRQRTAELTEKNKELEQKQKEITEHNHLLEEKTKEILKQKQQTEAEHKEAERAYKNIKMLKKVGARLNSTLDISEIFHIAYRHANVLIRDSNFGIGIVNFEKNQVEFIGYFKAGRKKVDYAPVSLTEENRLLVWCIQKQKEIFTNDYHSDYEKFTKQKLVIAQNNEFVKSLIYIPLISHDKVTGILMVQSEQTEAYEKMDLEILRNLASYVAISIDNAFAYSQIMSSKDEIAHQKKAVETAYQNIKMLQRVGEKINSTLDVDEIVGITYKSVDEFIKPSNFGIGILNKKEINFLIYYQNKQLVRDYKVSLSEKDLLMVWCVENRKEVFVNDYEEDYKEFMGKKPDHNFYKPTSLIYIPMLIQDKIMGIMLIESEQKAAFEEVHAEILRNLASYVAIGIDNAHAYTEIKTQNIKITDSLRYAQAIQATILPDTKRLERHFKDFFAIYKPVDMVSGDFYWLSDIGEEAVLVLADCTGHGVPGAFMSMIGNALLNEIINQNKTTNPAQILALLHIGVKRTLKQDSSQNTDGMDAAICHISKNKHIIISASKMSFFYVQNGQIYELKGDKFSLGGNRTIQKDFTNYQIQFYENDIIYLSSDGFYDQNNAEKQKFGKNRFIETLQNISIMDFRVQKQVLLYTLEQHQGEQAQRDDITVLGLKI